MEFLEGTVFLELHLEVSPCILKMKVFIERENRTQKLRFSGKVSALLKNLKLNPAAVLVSKNNSLVTEDDVLANSDDVKILSVISGG